MNDILLYSLWVLIGAFLVVKFYWHKRPAWTLAFGGFLLGVAFERLFPILLKAIGW